MDANADDVKYVGGNLVASGNAIIFYDNMRIEADRVVVNMATKDIEATGAVTINEREQYEEEVTLEQLNRLEKRKDLVVEDHGIATKPTGKRYYKVMITRNITSWSGTRIIGNMTSGFFEFDQFKTKSNNFYITAKSAIRTPAGIIDAKDITLSSCEYLIDDHEHWSMSAAVATFTPDAKAKKFSDIEVLQEQSDNYYVNLKDMVVYAGSVPVMWLPFFDLDTYHELTGVGFKYGDRSEWGTYVLLSKEFRIPGTPLQPRFMLDYYSDRGIGKGASLDYLGEDSFTDILLYQINDDNPDESQSDYDDTEDAAKNTGNVPDRFTIPEERHAIRFNHWKHLTPRLDFRTSINKMSDHQFMEDFFEDLEEDDPQPTTFAELDYQFDNAGLNLLMRPRLNDFYSVVERLPELNVDFYRQPLSDKTYYQGSSTLADLEMSWRDYDIARTEDDTIDPQNYKSSRFDSLHMFYFPKKKGNFNIIPRAGLRMTAYSNSSKNKVTNDDLENMFSVDGLRGERREDNNTINNYDDKGGSKLRFVGEIGLEVNTKYYKSWQDVKSAYWELDGLRHVVVPYANYNYTTDPTVDRDELYFFDAVDRIKEQHFTRFGAKNRLQTRRGDYGSQSIHNWMELENYVDYDFNPESGFEHISEIGSIFRFSPSEKLSLSSEALLDISSEEKGLKRFTASGNYKLTDQWKVHAGYTFQDDYQERGLNSMGSSLSKVVAGNDFERQYNKAHSLSAGLLFPLFEKAYGELSTRYDIKNGYFRSKLLRIVRNLHCWELAIEIEEESNNSSSSKEEDDMSFAYTMTLATLPEDPIEPLGGDVSTRRASY